MGRWKLNRCHMSVLVCESILGEYTRLLFYGGHTVSGLRVCSFSVSTSETTILKHTCSVRTSKTTLPKHTYRGGECVHTDTLSASFRYVRVTVTVLTVTFHFLWNRSPAQPSCKELRSKKHTFSNLMKHPDGIKKILGQSLQYTNTFFCIMVVTFYNKIIIFYTKRKVASVMARNFNSR